LPRMRRTEPRRASDYQSGRVFGGFAPSVVQTGKRSSGRSGRDYYTAEPIRQFGFKDDSDFHRIKLNALRAGRNWRAAVHYWERRRQAADVVGAIELSTP
jgi:hypothetical protein